MTVTENPQSSRARLRSDIAIAARVVPTHYPLETFIAVNPLAGLEGMPFEQAVRRAADLYGVPGTLSESAFRSLHQDGRITDTDLENALAQRFPNLVEQPSLRLGAREVRPLELLRADLVRGVEAQSTPRLHRSHAEVIAPAVAETVDAQTAKWCAAFFGSAAWPMPNRENGFYSAWRALASADHSLSRTARGALRRTPDRPDDAVLNALECLAVDDDARIGYLQAHLTKMPGWAAHIAWCSSRGEGIDLLDYLAMRLTYESILLGEVPATPVMTEEESASTAPSARRRAAHLITACNWGPADDDEISAAARVLAVMPTSSRQMLWQRAFEAHYRDSVLSTLTSTIEPDDPGPAHTQVVTCIDTRSEGLRRHLEGLAGYETLGFAGFFAVAIRFTDLMGGAASDLCPVLISPNHDVGESPAPGAAGRATRRRRGIAGLAALESAFHSAKEALAAPFTLAEAAGWAAAPLSAAKTFAPSASAGVRRVLRDIVAPDAPAVIDLAAMPDADQVTFAQVALTTMGLTRGFGRLVVLCAHGSSTENNPYQASLDCGACGGQAGGPNARTAVAILNRPQVRAGLRSLGIDIPAETWFMAAQHDTATDRVSLLDLHLIPPGHQPDVERLSRDLTRAGAALAAERCRMLPGAPAAVSTARAARHVATRSSDWAQVYPEWGLAGNALFVVAPRAVTRGIDLQRRAFLHSYDAGVDPDGAALETILTAPLVVAQWINCQYYFSTVSPQVFGAGTKTIHNVVGTAGVIAGHAGDLQLGLPWQSVSDGQRLIHEPMRLLAVVQAPLERIDMIVERNPILQRLFGNDWVALAARESPGQPWQRWTRNGWRIWTPSHDTVTTKEMIA
jgi:uncharacterized protein YbcC (UPF0753/DUF2309 family)